MREKQNPIVTVNQAKILYLLINTDKNSFKVGDFGTDLESFQLVVDAIKELVELGMMNTGQFHQESRSGRRKIDQVHKCKITKRGEEEVGSITGNYLNADAEFSLETWQ